MKQQSAEGGGEKDRRVAFLDESLDRGKLVYCYALSLCVFVEPRPAYFFTLQQVQICIFWVSATCLWIWHVAWKCIGKEPFVNTRISATLCNCYILGVVFILCLLNLQPLWVPGERRLMHRNLSRSLTLGHHVTFIMRIVCQTWTGRCHRGCTGAF